MDDIFVYVTKLPPRIYGFSCPCLEGYTVYIDEGLDERRRREVYAHELKHIRERDFEKEDVQSIESSAHKKKTPDKLGRRG